MSKRLLFVIGVSALVLLLALPSLAQEATEAPAAPDVAVQFIELTGPAAERDAEISSLVWYGDTLLMITENPFIYADEDAEGMFFALDKGDILEYLESDNPEPLEPMPVPIHGPDIFDAVSGFEVTFDGFEAAAVVEGANAFADDQIFLTIEADTTDEADPTMRGYIVWGTIMPGGSGIELRLDEFIRLPTQTQFENMSYENLFVAGDNLVAMYEINGAGVNAAATAVTVDLASGEIGVIPVENIEFRVTDATTPDENGVFWVTNYFFNGEDFLAVETDPLAEQYGLAPSQAQFNDRERLVALQYAEDGITRVDRAPIQLEMTADSNGRNWEGIVTLDDLGFLIVTDRFPRTLLGFVPAGE